MLKVHHVWLLQNTHLLSRRQKYSHACQPGNDRRLFEEILISCQWIIIKINVWYKCETWDSTSPTLVLSDQQIPENQAH
jgi:hypothetical protein